MNTLNLLRFTASALQTCVLFQSYRSIPILDCQAFFCLAVENSQHPYDRWLDLTLPSNSITMQPIARSYA